MATVITIINNDGTVITIVTYDPKTFTVQATAQNVQSHISKGRNLSMLKQLRILQNNF